ncbi:MAG: YdcF family protein [Lentisphaerae bacterium]|nr:YdcF family protein [Lentisphaerota bacterium]MCP4101356.1 YdcF family protein [Lentisphaerota bacterium]
MNTIVIVLGSPNDANGKLSTIALERCNQAIEQFKRYRTCKILVTGGFGEHFNTSDRPHAYYASQYLISHSIPKEDILEFVESSNTFEDALLAKPVIDKYQPEKMIIVTSDFHHDRVKYIFGKTFPDSDFTISCSKTLLPDEKLKRLKTHEQNALNRMLRN